MPYNRWGIPWTTYHNEKGYTMRHETVDYDVLAEFVPAFINGDYTGLTDDEIHEIADFVDTADAWARAQPGYRSHHWDIGGAAGFGRCALSHCFGEREQLLLVIMLDD